MKHNAKAGIIMATVMILSASGVFLVEVSDAEETVAPTSIDAAGFIALFSDGTLKLDKDYALADALVISGTATIDLAGHKLVNGSASHTISVAKDGKLVVTDSVGGGIVDNVTHGKAALYVDAGGEATLNGGTFERSAEAGYDKDHSGSNSWYTIANRGTVTINDGTTVLNGDAEKTGRFSSMIGNGYPTAKDNTDGHDVVLIINGGTFVGGLYNVKNDDYGVLIINGGTFRASTGNSNVLTWNDLTVTGGQFTSEIGAINAFDTSAAYNKGIVNISGGTYDCTDRIVFLGMDKDSTYTLDITFEGIKEGTLAVYGYPGVSMTGKVSINGNAVELKNIVPTTGFRMSAGSIDIIGSCTSTDDGSIVVNGDAKMSGTIDGVVTVNLASGSITIPEGKSLAGTIQMNDAAVTFEKVSAGTGGLVVTPTAIGGVATASEAGSIVIAGAVTVKSALTLDRVELSVPVGSSLSVPADATISAANGGSVSNAGSMSIDGSVSSPVSNTGQVRASAGAIVKGEISGDYEQAKPTIQKVDYQRITLGQSIRIPVVVSDGATLEISGVTWAAYADDCIVGTPDRVGQFTIFATPVINGNVGDSISFRVVVDQPSNPDVPEPEGEKAQVTEIDITPITTILIIVLGAIIVVMIVRALI